MANRKILRTTDLSIIVVSYNSAAFLANCLQSIRECVTVSHEVIVVDNGSSDGSVEIVCERFPEATLLVSPINLGFARANNFGVDNASGKYILLLNPDTLLLTDVRLAIAEFEAHKNLGLLGAKMLDEFGTTRPSAGYFPSPFRLLRFSGLYDFRVLSNQHIKVHWVEGSFLMTRKSLWKKLGGLDVEYFMYVEDMDFAKAVSLEGYYAAVCPSVRYAHFGGFSGDRFPWLVHGFKRFHKKYSSSSQRVLANTVLTIGIVVRLLVAIAKSPFSSAQIEFAKIYLKCLRN